MTMYELNAKISGQTLVNPNIPALEYGQLIELWSDALTSSMLLIKELKWSKFYRKDFDFTEK